MADQSIAEKALTVGTDQLIDVASNSADALIEALDASGDIVEQAGHGVLNVGGATKDQAVTEIRDLKNMLDDKIRRLRNAIVEIAPGGA